MDIPKAQREFQEFEDSKSNPDVTSNKGYAKGYGVTDGEVTVTDDEVTSEGVTSEEKVTSDEVTSDDGIVSDQPITQKELASRLGVKRPYIGKVLKEIKKFFPEEDLYENGKLSPLAQEQIVDYYTEGAKTYRKKMKSQTGGAIELNNPEIEKPAIPNIEPDVLPAETWDSETIADTFSRTQLAKRSGTEALQNAVDSKGNTDSKWHTFREVELRDSFADGYRHGAEKARAYVAGEEAAFQQFLQQVGKLPREGGDQ